MKIYRTRASYAYYNIQRVVVGCLNVQSRYTGTKTKRTAVLGPKKNLSYNKELKPNFQTKDIRFHDSYLFWFNFKFNPVKIVFWYKEFFAKLILILLRPVYFLENMNI